MKQNPIALGDDASSQRQWRDSNLQTLYIHIVVRTADSLDRHLMQNLHKLDMTQPASIDELLLHQHQQAPTTQAPTTLAPGEAVQQQATPRLGSTSAAAAKTPSAAARTPAPAGKTPVLAGKAPAPAKMPPTPTPTGAKTSPAPTPTFTGA